MTCSVKNDVNQSRPQIQTRWSNCTNKKIGQQTNKTIKKPRLHIFRSVLKHGVASFHTFSFAKWTECIGSNVTTATFMELHGYLMHIHPIDRSYSYACCPINMDENGHFRHVYYIQLYFCPSEQLRALHRGPTVAAGRSWELNPCPISYSNLIYFVCGRNRTKYTTVYM